MALSSLLRDGIVNAIFLLPLLLIALFSYRLVLHPLSGYPGPFIAKLTDAHNGIHSAQRHLHLVTRQDHLRYGPVIRHGPNKLVFNSAQALHDIYDNDKVVKSHVYTVSVQTPGVYSSFNVIDQDIHKIKRMITGQALNEQSMQIFAPVILKEVDLFIKLLHMSAKDDVPANMAERIDYLACDIVGQLGFGYPLNLQTNPDRRWFMDGMKNGNYFTNIRMQFFRIHQLRFNNVLFYFTKKNAEAVKIGGVVRMSEIRAEAVTFIPAGAISTSSGISALLFYLSRDPERYERLAEEIRTTFADGADIRNGPALSGCRYLRACFDESLRISPPIPGTLWREARSSQCDGPLVIDGHTILPGTQFSVNAYALHHNEEYFKEPFKFMPERWLDSKGDERARMLKAFSPFSIGYRACPGKPMAYLESSLVVAKIFWHFDFERAPGEIGAIGGETHGRIDGRGRPDEYQLYDILSVLHDGPYLVFKPRRGLEVDIEADGNSLQ